MKNQDYRLHSQRKNNQSLSSVSSSTPVSGIFESRPFIVQQKQQGSSQQPDLKASLMGAERYGHHLARIQSAGLSTTLEQTHVVQQKGKADLTVMSDTARNDGVIQMGRKRKKGDESDEEYVPPSAKQRPRWNFPKSTRSSVYEKTAHKRKRGNSKYEEIYTCRPCRRPLAGITKSGEFQPAKFNFKSKNKGTLKSQQSGALDHHPAWAGRHDSLVKANATNEQIRKDHDDPARLRAMCKKCNESHKYEGTKVSDYESDSDDLGYMTPDDEPLNKGNYKEFRYDKV
ncbi:GH-E family nuclease [Nostoc sp. UHCC 0251]|uniref:GH-E family nuclease n=1 Tax=Nostoc sp. UHCC 0251 TaxID=3110240 RepID=UPI002B1EE43B|nr:GH-E family nuclease [Nostoc sp. UHCC 0251]MEA5626573.1 GH-E family nuclease [Nostoc sp. UHCC 0251]